MKKIPLTQNKVAIVSDRDFEFISKFTWHNVNGRARTTINKKLILMHRLIMGLKHGDERQVDHINGNPLDNRRHNLRICTRSQNLGNSKKQKNATSKYKGVTWSKRSRKWRANIVMNGFQQCLGYFNNENEAADAYDFAAIQHFGEFAKLNCAEIPLLRS